MSDYVDVVKRSGSQQSESFDPDKLLDSIRAACLSVRSPEGEAEQTASRVVNAVARWVNSKPAVTSGDIRRVASEYLRGYHTDAAYMYSNQWSIL